MKVSEILHAKGAEVFTVAPTDTISKAVDVLGEKNVGAVLVVGDGGHLSGILSERDIVRNIRAQGIGFLSADVASCMTSDLHTCGPNATVDELLNQMTQKRIRHMPVLKNGKLAGMVSIGDVVKKKIAQSEQEAEAMKEYIAS